VKINRVLCFAAVAILAGMSAAASKADPIDPVLHAGDPACTAGSLAFDGSAPVSITLDASSPTPFSQDLCYTGSTTLEELTLQFVAPFGITFQFTGGTVAEGGPFPDIPDYSALYTTALAPPCDPTNPTTPCEQWTVNFFGPPGLAPGNGLGVFETPVAGGPLVPIVITVSAAVPEASTLLLLLAALVPTAWFGRKFRGATSAV
jgi:hypothetical protein